MIIHFVRQEKLSSIGLSPQSAQQPTHEASFYMEPLPSQTFSALIKIEMKIPQHRAKYCQDKFSQLSLTLNMPLLNIFAADFGNALINMPFQKPKSVPP